MTVLFSDVMIRGYYTTYFRSVIVFGSIRILDDAVEVRSAVEKLAVKYAPEDSIQHRSQMIDRDWKPLCMLEMTIEHMTGKETIELWNAR